MIKYIFKLGLRNLLKNKRNTFINLFSLTLGLTVLILIAVFARNELSIDSFHYNQSDIYKVSYGNSSATPGPLTRLLKNNFPEVKSATHIETKQFSAFSSVFTYDNLSFEIDNYYCIDSSFFNVFDFEVLQGDIKDAVLSPFSVILTESEAKRIFRDEPPIGKSIKLKTYRDFDFIVNAVVKDIPHNSSIQFNGLITESSIQKMGLNYLEDWGYTVYESYILLHQNSDIKKLERKLRNYLIDFYNTNLSGTASHADAQITPLSLHPLKDVYFSNHLTDDTTNRGNLLLVKAFIAIGILILALSIINYVNLTTARASLRNKEIGVQKVSGSNRFALIFQYLTETTIISFLAMITGILLALFLLPLFSEFMGFGNALKLPYSFLLIAVPLAIAIGVIAGLYPAFFLSSQKVIAILKNTVGNYRAGIRLRYALVVFQFFISISLITATMLIFKQINYVKNKDLGIDKEQVIYAKLPFSIMRGQRHVLKERLLELPAIKNVAFSSTIPGKISGLSSQEINGKTFHFASLWVDPEFIELYGLQLKKGRFFSEDYRSDINSTALINEAAVKEFDLEDPFKLEIRVPGGKAKVVGIVEDFNFKSLHNEIEPLTIVYLPRQGAILNMKLAGGNIPNTLSEVEKIWKELAPGIPFSYHFLDLTFEQLYKTEEKMSRAITFFSLIAILIAILGILSLSIFLCESKTKEIGIRKINGAKIREVILLLNKGFVLNLLLAFIISCPFSFMLIKKWLSNFAYKTSISPWIFIGSGIIASLISLSIVSWQSWKFAIKNPVDTIRHSE